MMKKIDKHYVSEIDKKMAEFNASHPLSAQQQAESDKYQRIHHLRDVQTDLQHAESEADLWS